jgi:hypothetical protein
MRLEQLSVQLLGFAKSLQTVKCDRQVSLCLVIGRILLELPADGHRHLLEVGAFFLALKKFAVQVAIRGMGHGGRSDHLKGIEGSTQCIE